MPLSVQQIRDTVEYVSYKPGFSFEVYDGMWEGPHIVIRIEEMQNAFNPGETIDLEIHSFLPPLASPIDLLQWLMWRLQRIEVHEMREWFRVDGQIVSDPHAADAFKDRESPNAKT